MNSALEFFHYPFVFCDKRIYDLFHNEVWSQLFLFQIRSCHGIKMAHTLRKKKRKNGYKYTSELKMITMHAGEHRRVLILVKKMTIFEVETPVSIFPIFVGELVNLSIYVSNQIIAPAPRVPRNSHTRRIRRVSWKYRDKPRWIKKFRNTRNNVTIISCHRVFFADWLAPW